MATTARTTTANGKNKRRPLFVFKAKGDEKGLQSTYSGSEGRTNPVIAETGNMPRGDARDNAQLNVPLVPFLSLYRFHTPGELALNLIGLICAAASGAAQVSPGIFLAIANHVNPTAFDDPHVWKAYYCICCLWGGCPRRLQQWCYSSSVPSTSRCCTEFQEYRVRRRLIPIFHRYAYCPPRFT